MELFHRDIPTMTTDLNERCVSKDITQELASRGFSKSGRNWYRALDEVIQVVNLQRSHWGSQYYINLAILIRQLEDLERPRHEQCHLIARLGMLTRQEQPNDFIIDLENVEAAEQWARIKGSFRRVGLSFLDTCSSVSGIRRFLRTSNAVVLTGEARELLRVRR